MIPRPRYLILLAASLGGLLILGACASSDFGRWAQLQKSYNTVVGELNNYRRPCVDQGPDHPLCLIDDAAYVRINVAVQRARVALDNALANAEAGADTKASFWINQAEQLIAEVLATELARAAAGGST